MEARNRIESMCATLLALTLSTSSWAGDVPEESVETTPDPVIATTCNVTGYKNEAAKYSPAREIPDGSAAGLVLGPLQFGDDGMRISKVVLEVVASHTKVGDLTIKLGYDLTCDGSIDYESVVACRPRGTQSTTPAPCGSGTGGGCSGDLSCGRIYTFSDDATSAMAVGTCPSTISTGCYEPPADGGTPLSVFTDLQKTGCWFFTIIDPIAPNKGSVCSWAVHILNHVAVGTESISWSTTKILYR